MICPYGAKFNAIQSTGFSKTANYKSATTETIELSGFTSGDSYYKYSGRVKLNLLSG